MNTIQPTVFHNTWFNTSHVKCKDSIQYENIDNIHRDKQKIILSELKDKLGLEVVSFKVVKLDLVNETATLMILFHDN